MSRSKSGLHPLRLDGIRCERFECFLPSRAIFERLYRLSIFLLFLAQIDAKGRLTFSTNRKPETNAKGTEFTSTWESFDEVRRLLSFYHSCLPRCPKSFFYPKNADVRRSNSDI